VCARYGGDEFVLLLPHTPADRAVVVADRACALLMKARPTWTGEARNVSLSVGIASSEDKSLETESTLVEAADRALYDAKRKGGASVVVAKHGTVKAP
jgi:two-component system cell cycle response regulator